MNDSPHDTRIVFFGTPEFALLPLEALIRENYQVVAVVTNPDERVGRKQALTPPPVKVLAQKHGIPVFQPERLNLELFKSVILPADLYVVAAYGKIIPKGILDIPRFKSLNIHPSLLPRWRGPSPIQYAILHGDAETGVTIIEMDEEMDHGAVVASSRYQVLSEKITYPELHDQLAKLGAELVIGTIPTWVRREITPQPQDDSQATYSKILTKDSGRIDWSQPAEGIERMVRAFTPWPSAWTTWFYGGRVCRIRIEEAEVLSDETLPGPEGCVGQDARHPLLVTTGRGGLAVKKLTLEGKKSMQAESFLKGYSPILGATLG